MCPGHNSLCHRNAFSDLVEYAVPEKTYLLFTSGRSLKILRGKRVSKQKYEKAIKLEFPESFGRSEVFWKGEVEKVLFREKTTTKNKISRDVFCCFSYKKPINKVVTPL